MPYTEERGADAALAELVAAKIEKNRKSGLWQTLVTIVATGAIAIAVQWGIFQAQAADMNRRLDTLEKEAIMRPEYDEGHRAIEKRLDRIEGKLDTDIRLRQRQ